MDVLLSSGKIDVEKHMEGACLRNWGATVCLEKTTNKSSQLGHVRFFTALLNYVSGTSHIKTNLVKCGASLKYVWKAPKFAKALEKLMPKSERWHFAPDSAVPNNVKRENSDTESEKMDETMALLLPYFILLKLDKWHTRNTDEVTEIVSSNKLRSQQQVWAVGTPFGVMSPDVFMNSVSHGIISNLSGDGNEVILTDARCIPGTEGGAIYVGNSFNR